MKKENRETAGIWADHLGDAHVGCYGLLDDLKTMKQQKLKSVISWRQAISLTGPLNY